MHRVLKLYTRRLAETRRRLLAEGPAPVAEIRRQSVVDRVAATIIQRIHEAGHRLGAGRDTDAGENEVTRDDKPHGWEPEFRFHRIDEAGQKRLATLVVGNGDFVFQRVEALSGPQAPSPGGPSEEEEAG
jgi:hypothetical protein